MDRRAALLAAALLVLAPLTGLAAASDRAHPTERSAALAGGTAGNPAEATRTVAIRRTVTLSLTPDRPGQVGVRVTFDVPDPVTNVSTSVPDDASGVETRGFRQDGPRRYNWTGTDAPSLTFSVPANETGESGYAFVDPGPWALVRIPQLSTRWSWTGDVDVTLRRHVEASGAGVTGRYFAYLGPHERRRAAANGQTFDLVLPAAADDLTPTPDEVFASLTAASRLDVGERDRRVLVVAAPSTVRWSSRGLTLGGADVWVVATERVASPNNAWLHEYLHTRSDFETAPSGRWLGEAVPTYFAALRTYQRGAFDYATLASFLRTGRAPEFRDDVLARPSTWSRQVNYYKGALALLAVDAELREATDDRATVRDVFARLNRRNETVTGEAFLETVADLGGESARSVAARYTTTDATPAVPTEEAFRRAFDTEPPEMDYSAPAGPLRVTGPYRNVSGESLPTVYAGERLHVPVAVRNAGGTAGPFTATLAVNGTAVARQSDTLAPGDQTTVSLAHTFDDAGVYGVLAGYDRFRLRVRAPATPTVTGLDAPATVDPDAPFTVTVTVTNDGDVPARATLPVTVDGQQVAERTVRLAPGAARTVEVSLTLSDTGEHAVAVGERTTRVRVAGPGSGTAAPALVGFGPAAALAALLLAAALRGVR